MSFFKTLFGPVRSFHPSETPHGTGTKFARARDHSENKRGLHGTGTKFAEERAHGYQSLETVEENEENNKNEN